MIYSILNQEYPLPADESLQAPEVILHKVKSPVGGVLAVKDDYTISDALHELKEDLKDEVLAFIKKRWVNTDGNWFNGNCYWFAKILCDRFRRLEMYYLPIQGHFIAGDGTNFYDASGEVKPEEEPWSLRRIRQEDPLWYRHLLKDCGR